VPLPTRRGGCDGLKSPRPDRDHRPIGDHGNARRVGVEGGVARRAPWSSWIGGWRSSPTTASMRSTVRPAMRAATRRAAWRARAARSAALAAAPCPSSTPSVSPVDSGEVTGARHGQRQRISLVKDADQRASRRPAAGRSLTGALGASFCRGSDSPQELRAAVSSWPSSGLPQRAIPQPSPGLRAKHLGSAR
jgi:hypothetical protein